MRPIDADYAKEHMRACELNGRQLYIMELEERLAVIDEVPTIDAEPVRHAYWIRQGIYRGDDTSGFIEWIYRCSNCGNEALMNNMRLIVLTGYCPYCGAKMDEERKEE